MSRSYHRRLAIFAEISKRYEVESSWIREAREEAEIVVAAARVEVNAVPTARPHGADPTALGWKNTLVLPSVSRARNLGSECV